MLLYHGTTPAKARRILREGFRPGPARNTFGRAVSFSDKPVGTRHHDRGAILVCRLKPTARILDLSAFQARGRNGADAVLGNPEGFYEDREIGVFAPEQIEILGWYDLRQEAVVPDEPTYPAGYRHSWA